MTSPSLQISNSEVLAGQPSGQRPTSTPKRFRRLEKGKGQRGRSSPSMSPVVEDELDHEHHLHHQGPSSKKKRAVPEELMSSNSSLAGRFEDKPHQHEEVALAHLTKYYCCKRLVHHEPNLSLYPDLVFQCLNLTELLHHYGLSPDSLISPAQFTYLCPALLYQIDSRLCILHYHQVDVQEAPQISGTRSR